MKAYVVKESWAGCNDYSVIGVFLDKEKCDEFISEKNKDRDNERTLMERCEKCREDSGFLLKDECTMCKISTDRYGEYCENDLSEEHCYTNDYYCEETNVLE